MDQASSIPAPADDSGGGPDRALPAHGRISRAPRACGRDRARRARPRSVLRRLPASTCYQVVFEGDEVKLSVQGRGVIEATVRWCQDGRAGLRFADDESGRAPVARKSNRRAAGMEAQLRRIGRTSYWVELRDLSPDGCMIDLVERPAMDEVMQVRLPGLETLQARVRWIDNYIAGLKFERPIHPAVFELLLQRMGR